MTPSNRFQLSSRYYEKPNSRHFKSELIITKYLFFLIPSLLSHRGAYTISAKASHSESRLVSRGRIVEGKNLRRVELCLYDLYNHVSRTIVIIELTIV